MRVAKQDKDRKLFPAGHVATLRYLSSNTSVATVDKSGRITGVAKGTCYVYALAHNGVHAKVKVNVR